jgi:hypothetical protein
MLVWAASSAIGEVRKLPDVSVKTDYGEFVFRDLEIKRGNPYALETFRGTIQNETGQSWTKLTFRPDLRDNRGRAINWKQDSFLYRRIGKGSSEKFDYQISGDIDTKSLGVSRVLMIGGSVPTVYKFSLVSPKSQPAPSFEDEFIVVKLAPSEEQLGITIQNKMPDQPIKIDWNQCSYVDASGKSERIIHQGIRLIDRNTPMPPTLIPPGASIEDVIVPSGNVYMSDITHKWSTFPMLPPLPSGAKLKGSTFSLFVPIEVNGTTKNYMFTLRVIDVVPE